MGILDAAIVATPLLEEKLKKLLYYEPFICIFLKIIIISKGRN
jgi:hypothetical protein